ncbi:uncharacterized protein LOC142346045 [Convolutriloba macropyga]|uniref:uncharacterized protein LOC142345619 n=1 Tax=Convolutriloba macropyga TaxID=536237 RepID=UPI003F51F62E
MSTYKVYVGNLTPDVREQDIHDAFMKYGDVDKIFMKDKFAFVHMLDSRDAEDAIRGLDGRTIAGCDKIRVEKPRDSRRPDTSGVAACYSCGQPGHIARDCRSAGSSRDGGRRNDGRCFSCGGTGHIARDCPDDQKQNNRNGSESRDRRSDNRSRSRNSRSRSRSPRY